MYIYIHPSIYTYSLHCSRPPTHHAPHLSTLLAPLPTHLAPQVTVVLGIVATRKVPERRRHVCPRRHFEPVKGARDPYQTQQWHQLAASVVAVVAVVAVGVVGSERGGCGGCGGCGGGR